uniref:Reticulocalbin-3 n=1 Tax=Romanomermis culicivorax TaxID=13658 RepID=A0A915J6Q1_ROMCU
MIRSIGFPFVLFLLIAVANGAPDAKTDKDHFSEGDHKASFDHEAFVGKEEALEYQNLKPEESKERLSKLLPVIDKDKDGFITEDELREHIKFMQKRYIMKDVDRTWANHGGNKSAENKLTWDDYRSTVYGSEENIDMPKEYSHMLKRDERRWKLADLDNDNSLSKEEYACFMHPEDCDHMKNVIVTETVEDIDKNDDGAVDLEEYISDMYRPSDHPGEKGEPDWVQAEREMFKTHRDKNKDGKLDNDELKEWIMPTGFDHAEAEAKHLLQIADDNKDGQLSKDEILTHYDSFVGSQATDYGEQLQKHDPSEL